MSSQSSDQNRVSRTELPADEVAFLKAREMLMEKHAELLAREGEVKARRTALAREIQKSEAELQSLSRRIDTLAELLDLDFPVKRPEPAQYRAVDWQNAPLVEAASEVLDEAGGFLTDSQIRQGLEQRGRHTEDTDALGREMDQSLEKQESPLLKIAPHLWARADWAEQARCSLPSLFRKKGH